jgi:uncharacterized protein with WD repeat
MKFNAETFNTVRNSLRETLAANASNYDPSQPREDDGKWTDEGGSHLGKEEDRADFYKAKKERMAAVEKSMAKEDEIRSKISKLESGQKDPPSKPVDEIEKELATIQASIKAMRASAIERTKNLISSIEESSQKFGLKARAKSEKKLSELRERLAKEEKDFAS